MAQPRFVQVRFCVERQYRPDEGFVIAGVWWQQDGKGLEIYYRPEFNAPEGETPGDTRADQLINWFVEAPRINLRNPRLLDYWSEHAGYCNDRAPVFRAEVRWPIDPEEMIHMAVNGAVSIDHYDQQ